MAAMGSFNSFAAFFVVRCDCDLLRHGVGARLRDGSGTAAVDGHWIGVLVADLWSNRVRVGGFVVARAHEALDLRFVD
ncbi:hypothetical protein Acr_15g0014060 [Actinidia rufa]|uniref:Uncharacterized protein n=1 Tax=Actinidia rufa TaxID=165716 RepID=A0A7J0FXY9_9ERIC|nr:hypothetical protein Acr_15g0014060 [Actinidia rufa]